MSKPRRREYVPPSGIAQRDVLEGGVSKFQAAITVAKRPRDLRRIVEALNHLALLVEQRMGWVKP